MDVILFTNILINVVFFIPCFPTKYTHLKIQFFNGRNEKIILFDGKFCKNKFLLKIKVQFIISWYSTELFIETP